MGFQRDYIMRMIEEAARVLASIVFGKNTANYELSAEEHYSAADELYIKIITLADAGQINEAENLLFQKLDGGESKIYEAALAFYDHISGFDDDFLQAHDYSKEEIQLGLQNLARTMGVESVVEALL